MVTRIGIIGDIHAEDALLKAALDFLRQQPLDAILCVGDVVTGPGDAGECCRLLQNANVSTVRGNHDRWFLNNSRGLGGYLHLPRATSDDEITGENRLFLESLPMTQKFETPSGMLLLCHGLGEDDTAGVYPGDTGAALEGNQRLHSLLGACEFQFVVNGHTHERMVRRAFRPLLQVGRRHTHKRMVRRFNHLTMMNPGTLRRDLRPGFAVADFIVGQAQFYDLDPETRQVSASEMFAL